MPIASHPHATQNCTHDSEESDSAFSITSPCVIPICAITELRELSQSGMIS